MREHRACTENLLLTADARYDDLARAAGVLDELARRFGHDVDELPDLAVAVAIVHDSERPLTRNVNGVITSSPEPRRIFEYFRDRLRSNSDVRALPPELLAYIVDPTVSAGELRWAETQYAKRPGTDLYHQVSYDRSYFLGGERSNSSHPYTLANVRQYGGVCADRSFFGANTSKALLIPSAIFRGVRSDVTHSWMAQFDIKAGEWRETGRSAQFANMTGRVLSPQTRKDITDDELQMLGGVWRVASNVRLEALALAHLARAGRGDSLPLVRRALEMNPACMPAWAELRRRAPDVTKAELADWQEMVRRIAPPQFATRLLLDFAGSSPQFAVRQQEYAALYDSTANADLACDIRFAQAMDLASNGMGAKAIELCREAAVEHWRSGDGTLLLTATARDIAARDNGRHDLLALYSAVFTKFPRPDTNSAEFTRHTAWRLLGEDYAKALREHGRDDEAEQVLEKIGAKRAS